MKLLLLYKEMINKFSFLFVTMMGIGKVSKIPGSIASLVTVILLYIYFHVANLSPNYFLIFLLLIFIISLFTINKYIKDSANKDPKEIVIDEFIGQSIPISLYEVGHTSPENNSKIITIYFVMFVLFRIFDILKPYPISYYDKNFKNSIGVVMDDVCAGLYVVAITVTYMVFST